MQDKWKMEESEVVNKVRMTQEDLDGVLSAEEDVLLLRLSQRSPAHAAVSQTLYTRPAQTGEFPLPSAAASPHQVAQRHISLNRATLVVPHLCLPWAESLKWHLYRLFQVHLIPFYASHSPKHVSFSQLISCAHTLYAPLPHHITAYNHAILNHIRITHSPCALHRVSNLIRLAYANSLHASFLSHFSTLQRHLSHLTPPSPPSPHPVCPHPPARVRVHATKCTTNAYILAGVVVPAPLLSRATAALARRGIIVHVTSVARDNSHAIRAYAMEVFNASWPDLMRNVIHEARQQMRDATRRHVTEEIRVVRNGIADAVALVDVFVARALRLEVAGASLATICAFEIAGAMGVAPPLGEVERGVEEARVRVGVLKGGDIRPEVLLGG